ncbi:hypothetical protein ACRYCC_41070 [Actinomadura scrupuli]|uniref:hypothetical protein n=1 Tax=Actinomadura scrupuli TaxID=559629 RepID=UPI003D962F0A
MDQEPQRLGELFPTLVGELVGLLRAEGEDELASWVPFLRFREWCSCDEDSCQSFYTAPRPEGAYGPGHRCVSLLQEKAMIVLDVVDDDIRFVEILGGAPLSAGPPANPTGGNRPAPGTGTR